MNTYQERLKAHTEAVSTHLEDLQRSHNDVKAELAKAKASGETTALSSAVEAHEKALNAFHSDRVFRAFMSMQTTDEDAASVVPSDVTPRD